MAGWTGREHSVFLDDVGGVWTAGSGASGQLGHGEEIETLTELKRVEGLPPCCVVEGGERFTACVTLSGDLYCFGEGHQGQLGQGHTNTLYTPHKVNGLPPIDSVACGDHFTVCVGRDSSVWAFGYNFGGQLGLGHTEDVSVPTRVELSASQVACGAEHTLFLDLQGQVWTSGKVLPAPVNKPTHIPLDLQVDSIHCGCRFSIIRAVDGSLWGHGHSNVGQLGLIDKTDQFQQIPELTVARVWCGYQHVMALDYDGCLWGWGLGGFGQLGDNRRIKNPRPRILHRDVQGMVTGYHSTFIRTTEDRVEVCGYNEHGQLSLGHRRFSVAWTSNTTIPPEVVPRITQRHLKSAMSSLPH